MFQCDHIESFARLACTIVAASACVLIAGCDAPQDHVVCHEEITSWMSSSLDTAKRTLKSDLVMIKECEMNNWHPRGYDQVAWCGFSIRNKDLSVRTDDYIEKMMKEASDVASQCLKRKGFVPGLAKVNKKGSIQPQPVAFHVNVAGDRGCGLDAVEKTGIVYACFWGLSNN